MLFGEFGFDDSLDGESDDGEFLLIIDGLILLLKSLLFGIWIGVNFKLLANFFVILFSFFNSFLLSCNTNSIFL